MWWFDINVICFDVTEHCVDVNEYCFWCYWTMFCWHYWCPKIMITLFKCVYTNLRHCQSEYQFEGKSWEIAKILHEDLEFSWQKKWTVEQFQMHVDSLKIKFLYFRSHAQFNMKEIIVLNSVSKQKAQSLESAILWLFLTIFLQTTLLAFTKLRFWRLFWWAQPAKILIGSKTMT